MDEFTIFVLMTNDMTSLLEIPWLFMRLLCSNVDNFFGWPWGICAMQTCVSHLSNDYVL
jgi:hypothetical protein